ncbi:MAG: hypothetical protein K1000chlam3_00945, partial [Chlamydiae bacterium]|nr:hypothetical protein [Chlamydiota bacterium]
SLVASILTSPAYFIAPKRYAKITNHTADSARTIVAAAKRTFGAETKKAVAPAPKIAPSRVEKCKEFAKAQITNALQFSKDNQKAMLAATLTIILLGAYAYQDVFFKYLFPPTPSSFSSSTPNTTTKIVQKLGICLPSEAPKKVVNPFPQVNEIASIRHARCFSKIGNASSCIKIIDSKLTPNLTEHLFTEREAAAVKLLTEKHPSLIVSEEYGKLCTEPNYLSKLREKFAAEEIKKYSVAELKQMITENPNSWAASALGITIAGLKIGGKLLRTGGETAIIACAIPILLLSVIFE